MKTILKKTRYNGPAFEDMNEFTHSHTLVLWGVDVKRDLAIHNLRPYLGSVVNGHSLRQQKMIKYPQKVLGPMRPMAIGSDRL